MMSTLMKSLMRVQSWLICKIQTSHQTYGIRKIVTWPVTNQSERTKILKFPKDQHLSVYTNNKMQKTHLVDTLIAVHLIAKRTAI